MDKGRVEPPVPVPSLSGRPFQAILQTGQKALTDRLQWLEITSTQESQETISVAVHQATLNRHTTLDLRVQHPRSFYHYNTVPHSHSQSKSLTYRLCTYQGQKEHSSQCKNYPTERATLVLPLSPETLPPQCLGALFISGAWSQWLC